MQEQERYEKLVSVTDKLLNKIEGLVESLATETMNKDILKALTAALKEIKEIESLKCELDEKEQKAKIAKLLLEAEKPDTDDKTITLKLSKELKKYSK